MSGFPDKKDDKTESASGESVSGIPDKKDDKSKSQGRSMIKLNRNEPSRYEIAKLWQKVRGPSNLASASLYCVHNAAGYSP